MKPETAKGIGIVKDRVEDALDILVRDLDADSLTAEEDQFVDKIYRHLKDAQIDIRKMVQELGAKE